MQICTYLLKLFCYGFNFRLIWFQDFQFILENNLRDCLEREPISVSVLWTEKFAQMRGNNIALWVSCVGCMSIDKQAYQSFVSLHTETPFMKHHNKGGDINKEEPSTRSSLISWVFVLGLKKNICDLHLKHHDQKQLPSSFCIFLTTNESDYRPWWAPGFLWPCCTDNIWSFLQ